MLFACCHSRWPLRAGAVGSWQRASQRRRGGRSRADSIWGRVDLCADAAAAHSHGAAGEKLSPGAVAPCSVGATAQFGPFPVAKAVAAFWGGGDVLCRPDDVCRLPAAPLEGRTLPAKGAGRSPASGEEWWLSSSTASQKRGTAAERGSIVWRGASAPTAAGGKGTLLPANGAWPVGRPCRRGEGGRSTPFCLFTAAIPGRSEMAAALTGRSPPSPPSWRGERRPFWAGASRRGVCGGSPPSAPRGQRLKRGDGCPCPRGKKLVS